MTIAGFNLKKILVERKSTLQGELRIDTKTNITDIKKEELKLIQGKEAINFSFNFSIHYLSAKNQSEAAEISFEGEVIYIADSKDSKKIIDDWKKKEIDEKIRIQILNTILLKCNLKSLLLEDELGLPPHLPLPRLKPEEKKK